MIKNDIINDKNDMNDVINDKINDIIILLRNKGSSSHPTTLISMYIHNIDAWACALLYIIFAYLQYMCVSIHYVEHI